MNDYKVYNANVCMLCSLVEPLPTKNGIKPMICGECNKKLKEVFDIWNKDGIYLTPHTNQPIIQHKEIVNE